MRPPNGALGRSRRGEGGFATVEFALAIPAVVILFLALLALVAGGAVGLRAAEAARVGAREAAIGATEQRVGEVVREVAGPSASITLQTRGEFIEVKVTVPVAGKWGPFSVSRAARALAEPGK